MTFGILKRIIEKYNIPEDVHLIQDCGWECSYTELDGVWYSKERNEITFTQCGKFEFNADDECTETPSCMEEEKGDWVCIYYDDGHGRSAEL